MDEPVTFKLEKNIDEIDATIVIGYNDDSD